VTGQAPQITDPLDFLDMPSGQQDPLSFLDPVGQSWAEEAQGFGEKALWQTIGAGKAAADAITHIGTLAAKTAWGVDSALSGGSFQQGWDFQSGQMVKDIGTADPGALELMESIGRKIGLADEDGPAFGREVDETITKRLGKSRVLGDTIGTIASFATGPGAMLGRAGAEIARPMANVAERMLARAAASRAGIARETIDPLVSSGRAWEFLAANPGWQKAAGLAGRMEAAAGKGSADLLGTTAANIAQSYAMAPDDQRLEGAKAAMLMSPFMVPIARVGQRLADLTTTAGIGEQGARAVKTAFDDWEAGRIGARQLDQVVRMETSAAARGAALGIASAFEGTAFFGMSPESWDAYRRWQGGDPEAGAELLTSWLGTVGGVVAAKKLVPGELAPLFRTILWTARSASAPPAQSTRSCWRNGSARTSRRR
jgi:hypothetical protein